MSALVKSIASRCGGRPNIQLRPIRFLAHEVTVDDLEEQGGDQPLESPHGREEVQVQQDRDQDDAQRGGTLEVERHLQQRQRGQHQRQVPE